MNNSQGKSLIWGRPEQVSFAARRRLLHRGAAWGKVDSDTAPPEFPGAPARRMPAMDCHIRPETPADHVRVFEVVKDAYETPSEALLVKRLRAEASPLVSLVAEVDRVVAAHILFTPVAIGDAPMGPKTMGLAPLAVHPDYQDQGLGSQLARAGLEACAAAGCEVVVTLGHPDYYQRFGFSLAVEQGISYVGPEYDPFFMVKELVPGALEKYSGEVRYHDAIEEMG